MFGTFKDFLSGSQKSHFMVCVIFIILDSLFLLGTGRYCLGFTKHTLLNLHSMNVYSSFVLVSEPKENPGWSLYHPALNPGQPDSDQFWPVTWWCMGSQEGHTNVGRESKRQQQRHCRRLQDEEKEKVWGGGWGACYLFLNCYNSET